MGGATLDMGSALAVAEAAGVPRVIAAELLMACSAGILSGQMRRKEHET